MNAIRRSCAPAGVARAGLWLWGAALATVLWMLHRMGGDLTTPPRPWRWDHWLTQVDPAAAVVAVLRLIAIGAAWYLVVLTLLGTLARRADAEMLVVATDKASPAVLRRLLASAGGLTLSAAGLTLSTAPLLSPDAAGPVGDVGATAVDPATLQMTEPPRRATLEHVAAPPLAADESSGDADIATLAELEFSLAALTLPAEPPQAWLTRTGDHFWLIAEETLSDEWERPASEAEIAAYWRELIDLNRSRLVVAGNPDLIFPGQVFELPPVSAAPGQPAGA